jgi:hypothetical protein
MQQNEIEGAVNILLSKVTNTCFLLITIMAKNYRLKLCKFWDLLKFLTFLCTYQIAHGNNKKKIH